MIGNIRVLLKPCVSQPPPFVSCPPIDWSKYTVTNFTPASANLRARRQLCP
jgi:hypothetical protein